MQLQRYTIWYNRELICQTDVTTFIMTRYFSIITTLVISTSLFARRCSVFAFTRDFVLSALRRKEAPLSPNGCLSRITSSCCFYFNYLMVSCYIEVYTYIRTYEPYSKPGVQLPAPFVMYKRRDAEVLAQRYLLIY